MSCSSFFHDCATDYPSLLSLGLPRLLSGCWLRCDVYLLVISPPTSPTLLVGVALPPLIFSIQLGQGIGGKRLRRASRSPLLSVLLGVRCGAGSCLIRSFSTRLACPRLFVRLSMSGSMVPAGPSRFSRRHCDAMCSSPLSLECGDIQARMQATFTFSMLPSPDPSFYEHVIEKVPQLQEYSPVGNQFNVPWEVCNPWRLGVGWATNPWWGAEMTWEVPRESRDS